jgi:hypothetical protein
MFRTLGTQMSVPERSNRDESGEGSSMKRNEAEHTLAPDVGHDPILRERTAAVGRRR